MKPMEMMEWSGAEATVATVAIVLSLLSFGFTFWLDRRGDKRDTRIEKSEAYLQLELASIEVFKYKADHWDALLWSETGENPLRAHEHKLREEADSFFYQCLNLFEVASRYRQNEVIDADIYASWVAWFYETLEYRWFRSRWIEEYSDNYTSETQAIFAAGIGLDWSSADDHERRKAFYTAVSKISDCPVIAGWQVEGTVAQGNSLAAPSVPQPVPAIEYIWHDGTLVKEAAAFAGRVIGAQNSYISHGEIQVGLSPDGVRWIDELEARYASDFSTHDEREMLLARAENGAIVGLGVLSPKLEGAVRFGVLEDMAVEPELRGAGIGGALLSRLTKRAEELGCDWLFLESGLGNEGAHRFFVDNGFDKTSHVFAKRLSR